jgi:hypothetical protein
MILTIIEVELKCQFTISARTLREIAGLESRLVNRKGLAVEQMPSQ